MRLFFLLGMLCSAPVLAVAGASGWQLLGFDGNTFQKGAADGAIQVRDGYLPVPAAAGTPPDDKLPDGTGALALLCFLQSSGGKLALPQPTVTPLAGVAVTLSAKALTVAGRTDASGYLILALPPGSYQAHLLGFSQKVSVQTGKTALVAIRGAKRMVD